MKNRSICLFLTACMAMLLSATTWADRLSATVDRDDIGLNETVNLRVVFDGDQVSGSPDFSGLSQNFDILNNQRYSQQSIVNGQISQSTEWRLTIAPKKTGQLLIPPFNINGESSRPLKIQVHEPATSSLSGKQDVFVETSVEPEKGFVQQQFIVTYALYYNRNVDNLDMPDFQVTNARVESLPRVDYQKTVGQQTYGVSEFRYAVFPDASNTLTIPGQTWTVRTTDQASISRFGFGGGRMKLHRVKTDTIILSVEAKPDSYPNDQYWLPANSVTISQQWSRDIDDFKVGEPITRTVTLVANGAGGEQLPPMFDQVQAPGFKFYPDKPKQDSELTAQGVIGTRTESVAIVPSEPGELTLPEVRVAWWNNSSQKIEFATLEAVTVNVSGTAPVTQPASPSEPSTTVASAPSTFPGSPTEQTVVEKTPFAWIIAATVSFALNLLLLGMIWSMRKQTQSSSMGVDDHSENRSAAQWLSELNKSCQSKSAGRVRRALLKWVEVQFPQSPATLKTVAERSKNETLTRELNNLERQLFHDPHTPVDFPLIYREVSALNQTVDTTRKQALQPFYPSSGQTAS